MKVNIKKELYDWFKRYDWDVSITLTFADEFSARRALAASGKFWNETDYCIYKNASRKYNKRCQRVMMLEGDGDGQRFHLHGAAITPRDRFVSDETFCRFLHNRWLSVHPDHLRVEFKPTWDADGWSWYITKKTSHFDCDSFDVHSSYIAAPNLQTVSRTKAFA